MSEIKLTRRLTISSFHIGIVRDNIDKILTGELSNEAVLRLINEKARLCNETTLCHNRYIKRIVGIVLEEKPEELERYNKMLQGRKIVRSQQKGYVESVIHDYLPRYLASEITLKDIAKELNTNVKTLDRIIIRHYTLLGDTDGLNKYKDMKKRMRGRPIEQRKATQQRREEILKSDTVPEEEFLLLSDEEQDRQIIEKYRKDKLKSNIQKGNVVQIELVERAVERIKEYFRGKNDIANGIENFSEQDIKYIIFSYPSILGRNSQTLDEKLNTLTVYQGIDKKTAYRMIKTFPAVLGYSPQRTKAQLDLLQKENLIDVAINNPRRMMTSVNLMYALIEYAKKRYETTDLSNVEESDIFIQGSILKSKYGCTPKELKERFPYELLPCTINGETIGRTVGHIGPHNDLGTIENAYAIVAGAVSKLQEGSVRV